MSRIVNIYHSGGDDDHYAMTMTKIMITRERKYLQLPTLYYDYTTNITYSYSVIHGRIGHPVQRREKPLVCARSKKIFKYFKSIFEFSINTDIHNLSINSELMKNKIFKY